MLGGLVRWVVLRNLGHLSTPVDPVLVNVTQFSWPESQATEHERDELHLLAPKVALDGLCSSHGQFELTVGQREFFALCSLLLAYHTPLGREPWNTLADGYIIRILTQILRVVITRIAPFFFGQILPPYSRVYSLYTADIRIITMARCIISVYYHRIR
jgi:hypothetical protein